MGIGIGVVWVRDAHPVVKGRTKLRSGVELGRWVILMGGVVCFPVLMKVLPCFARFTIPPLFFFFGFRSCELFITPFLPYILPRFSFLPLVLFVVGYSFGARCLFYRRGVSRMPRFLWERKDRTRKIFCGGQPFGQQSRVDWLIGGLVRCSLFCASLVGWTFCFIVRGVFLFFRSFSFLQSPIPALEFVYGLGGLTRLD